MGLGLGGGTGRGATMRLRSEFRQSCICPGTSVNPPPGARYQGTGAAYRAQGFGGGGLAREI